MQTDGDEKKKHHYACITAHWFAVIYSHMFPYISTSMLVQPVTWYAIWHQNFTRDRLIHKNLSFFRYLVKCVYSLYWSVFLVKEWFEYIHPFIDCFRGKRSWRNLFCYFIIMYSAIKGVLKTHVKIKNRFINVTSFLNFTLNSKRVTTSPDYQGDLISYHSTYVKKVYYMLRILNNYLHWSHGMPTRANKTLKTGLWVFEIAPSPDDVRIYSGSYISTVTVQQFLIVISNFIMWPGDVNSWIFWKLKGRNKFLQNFSSLMFPAE